jgi:hypothetical protein
MLDMLTKAVSGIVSFLLLVGLTNPLDQGGKSPAWKKPGAKVRRG